MSFLKCEKNLSQKPQFDLSSYKSLLTGKKNKIAMITYPTESGFKLHLSTNTQEVSEISGHSDCRKSNL